MSAAAYDGAIWLVHGTWRWYMTGVDLFHVWLGWPRIVNYLTSSPD